MCIDVQLCVLFIEPSRDERSAREAASLPPLLQCRSKLETNLSRSGPGVGGVRVVEEGDWTVYKKKRFMYWKKKKVSPRLLCQRWGYAYKDEKAQRIKRYGLKNLLYSMCSLAACYAIWSGDGASFWKILLLHFLLKLPCDADANPVEHSLLILWKFELPSLCFLLEDDNIFKGSLICMLTTS